MALRSILAAAAALAFGSAFAAPLGSWSFGNGFEDDTGNGHALTGGTGATVSDGAIHFGAAADDTSWARTGDMLPLSGAKTMTPIFWVRCDADKQPTDSRHLVEFLNGTSRAVAGDLSFTVEGADGGYILMSLRLKTTEVVCSRKSRNGVLADGEWHCIAARLGSGASVTPTCELYIDGVLDSTVVENNTGGSTFTSYKTMKMHLARRGGATASEASFCGDMDEIAVYGSSLSATDILSEFYRTLPLVYNNDESRYQRMLPPGARLVNGQVLYCVRVTGNASVACDKAAETPDEKTFWVPTGATNALTVMSEVLAGARVRWRGLPDDSTFAAGGTAATFVVTGPENVQVDIFTPTHVWTGAAGEDFADAANWTNATATAAVAAPHGSDSFVYIPSAGAAPVVSAATTVGDLIFGDGAAEAGLAVNAELTVCGNFSVERFGTVTANHPIVVSNDVTVARAGVITHTGTCGGKLGITVCGDMAVEAGGKVDVSQCGYTASYSHANDGPGGSSPGDTSGPSAYGGRSDSAKKPCYGSIRRPIDWGTGGYRNQLLGSDAPPRSGGGVIRLSVAGTLTVNGEVRADGCSPKYTYNAGTGGSVWLSAKVLEGGGTISCRPGNHDTPGGGRMAIYQTEATDLSAFTGTFDSREGTRYIENNGDVPGRGMLILDGSMFVDFFTNQVRAALGAADGDQPFGRIVCTGTMTGNVKDGILVKVCGDVVATNATVAAEEGTAGGLEILGAAEGVTHLAGTFRLGSFVCTNGTAALEFAAGTSVTNYSNGTLWLDGGRSPGGKMALRSSVTGQAWRLNAGTNLTGKVQNLDVSDSDASGGQTITPRNSVGKRARNLNWVFPSGLMLMVK